MSNAHATVFVLFNSDQDVTPHEVEQALRTMKDVDVEVRSPAHFVVLDNAWSDDPWEVHVRYAYEPQVLEESQEIAEEVAVDQFVKEYIATCDRRIVVSYEIDPAMDYFNTWIFTTELVASLVVKPVLFDPVNGRFP